MLVPSATIVAGETRGMLPATRQEDPRWTPRQPGNGVRRSGRRPPRIRARSRTAGTPMSVTAPTPVQELVERSNRLGADRRNTSAKGAIVDPVTGRPTELLWVKGSGGDLGTLTEAGLSVLRLDRLRALVDVYPGVER